MALSTGSELAVDFACALCRLMIIYDRYIVHGQQSWEEKIRSNRQKYRVQALTKSRPSTIDNSHFKYK